MINRDIFDELFVLELANNHWGDLQRGLRIVKEFSTVVRYNDVRAAIKLQFRDVDSFIHKDFVDRTDIRYVKKTLDTRLTKAEMAQLVEAVRRNNCIRMATPFDEASVDLCEELGIEIIKIASSDITDWPLLERIARTRKPVIVSTGGASIRSMDAMVTFFENRHIPLAINHCVSLYPTEDADLELNQIDFLRHRYPGVTIGFSTHEYHDWTASIMMAYAKGARTFERHIDIKTEDRPFSPYCSTPEQVAVWFRAFHKAKEMCGGSRAERRRLPAKEVEYLDALVRGVYAKRDLPAGHVLTDDDYYLAIPLQKGQLSCRELITGDPLVMPVAKDEPITIDAFDTPYGRPGVLHDVIAQRGIDPGAPASGSGGDGARPPAGVPVVRDLPVGPLHHRDPERPAMGHGTQQDVRRSADGGLIVVAGAGGFIGGHLVAALRSQGRRVRAVDVKPLAEWHQCFTDVENVVADLKLREECHAVCGGARVVYQLAADMGGMGFIERNKALCMLSVLTNTHMLEAARAAGVERFFYSSSACVYNAAKQRSAQVVPLREEDAYPADPEDGYGWEKLFSERMCRHFREDFGLQTRVARYHNVYGPHGTWEGGREKAPAAICRKVIEAAASGNHQIEIWGDGEQTRSFMYIDDCIRGTQEILASDIVEPLNLGSSELVTINELVTIVEEIAGVKLERRYDPTAPKGVNGRNSDNTRLRAALGWEPSTPLRVGMERTYRWIYDEFTRKYGGVRAPSYHFMSPAPARQ